MRQIVIVSGSGRSGTSLVMQLLHACGLEVSGDLTPASNANPRGAWEDRAILDEHRRLFDAVGARTLPPPEDWSRHPIFQEVTNALGRILADRLSTAMGLWGFKDPRASLFLPLWKQLLEAHDAEMRLVLCVRNAQSVVRSLMKNHNHDSATAQSLYFFRNARALADCPDNTFFIHYEDLLRKNSLVLKDLCRFCGLADAQDPSLKSVMEEACDPELNRAGGPANISLNAPVQELNRFLRQLRGMPSDMDRVRTGGRELLEPLRRWNFVIEGARTAIGDREARLARARKERSQQFERIKRVSRAKIAEVEARSAREIERIKQANARLKAESDKTISVLRREIRRLEIRQQGLVRKEGGTKQGSLDGLLQRLGEAVLKAFERPGVRTFRLPWKLVRLYRKREQIHGEATHGEHDELLQQLGGAVLKAFERPGLRTFRLPWKLVRLYRKREQIHVGAGMRRREEAERRLSLPVETTLEAPEVRPGAEGR